MKCVVEGCGRDACSRGLCQNCYASARRKIAAGDETWEKLVARGLALDAKIKHNKEKKKCLIRSCEDSEHMRGLCLRCYRAASQRVHRKATTWELLQQAGLALPAKLQCRERPAFSAAFEANFDRCATEEMRQRRQSALAVIRNQTPATAGGA